MKCSKKYFFRDCCCLQTDHNALQCTCLRECGCERVWIKRLINAEKRKSKTDRKHLPSTNYTKNCFKWATSNNDNWQVVWLSNVSVHRFHSLKHQTFCQCAMLSDLFVTENISFFLTTAIFHSLTLSPPPYIWNGNLRGRAQLFVRLSFVCIDQIMDLTLWSCTVKWWQIDRRQKKKIRKFINFFSKMVMCTLGSCNFCECCAGAVIFWYQIGPSSIPMIAENVFDAIETLFLGNYLMCNASDIGIFEWND